MKNFQLLPQAYPIADDTLNLFLDFMPKWQSSYERTNDKISENYNDFMMNQNVNVPSLLFAFFFLEKRI